VKEFLSRAGHPFTVRVVDEDDDAYDALLQLGQRTVPVTVINGHVIAGFNPDALSAALTENRRS
jgi:glutaredoxin